MPSFLITVAGPTASGKTAFSIELAKHFNTEILSADSRQFYREISIGTSKPSPEQLSEVPHHFVGNLSVSDEYNTYLFEEDAIRCLGKIFSSGSVAVMTGGSGLYLDAVCNGMDAIPPSDKEIRRELETIFEEDGIESLQQRLRVLDPGYYAEVDLKNPRRLFRALEVCLLTGKAYSSFRKKTRHPRPFTIIKTGMELPREVLYERINSRVDAMFAAGLVEEVRSMIPYRHLTSLNTVGYRELFDYFDGSLTLDQAADLIKKNTRHYARRQLTWFRRDKEIKWFNPQDVPGAVEYVKKKMREGGLSKIVLK